MRGSRAASATSRRSPKSSSPRYGTATPDPEGEVISLNEGWEPNLLLRSLGALKLLLFICLCLFFISGFFCIVQCISQFQRHEGDAQGRFVPVPLHDRRSRVPLHHRGCRRHSEVMSNLIIHPVWFTRDTMKLMSSVSSEWQKGSIESLMNHTEYQFR